MAAHLKILRRPEAGRVRDDGDCAPALEREMPHGRSPEAVARRPDPGHTLSLEGLDDGVYHGAPGVGTVLGYPGGAVKVLGGVEAPWVALEDVGHDCAITVACEVIGEKLWDSKLV